MIFELNHIWTITLNFLLMFIFQFGPALLCMMIPVNFFSIDKWFFRTRVWEGGGAFYKRYFKVNKWKHLLPDGAGFLKKGFPKRKLKEKSIGYLELFMKETCRAEMTHWLAILPIPIFLLWNPWWSMMILITYALIVNVPCIITQRYNRARILKIIK